MHQSVTTDFVCRPHVSTQKSAASTCTELFFFFHYYLLGVICQARSLVSSLLKKQSPTCSQRTATILPPINMLVSIATWSRQTLQQLGGEKKKKVHNFHLYYNRNGDICSLIRCPNVKSNIYIYPRF